MEWYHIAMIVLGVVAIIVIAVISISERKASTQPRVRPGPPRPTARDETPRRDRRVQ